MTRTTQRAQISFSLSFAEINARRARMYMRLLHRSLVAAVVSDGGDDGGGNERDNK